jgi:hypothetical protein
MSTKYVVLSEHDTTFTVVAEVEARTSEHAVRLVVEQINGELPPGGVTHIAVPERSWRTGRHTFKVETKRRLFTSSEPQQDSLL